LQSQCPVYNEDIGKLTSDDVIYSSILILLNMMAGMCMIAEDMTVVQLMEFLWCDYSIIHLMTFGAHAYCRTFYHSLTTYVTTGELYIYIYLVEFVS